MAISPLGRKVRIHHRKIYGPRREEQLLRLIGAADLFTTFGISRDVTADTLPTSLLRSFKASMVWCEANGVVTKQPLAKEQQPQKCRLTSLKPNDYFLMGPKGDQRWCAISTYGAELFVFDFLHGTYCIIGRPQQDVMVHRVSSWSFPTDMERSEKTVWADNFLRSLENACPQLEPDLPQGVLDFSATTTEQQPAPAPKVKVQFNILDDGNVVVNGDVALITDKEMADLNDKLLHVMSLTKMAQNLRKIGWYMTVTATPGKKAAE